MSQVVEAFLSPLVTGLPQITMAVVGLVLAHTRLKRFHPRAYRYGNIGLSLLLVNALWSASSRAYIQAHLEQSQDSLALTKQLTMTGLVSYVIFTASLAFIVVAIFADRDLAKSSRGAAQQIAAAGGDP